MTVICRAAGLTDLSELTAFAKAKHQESNWAFLAFNAQWFRGCVKKALYDQDQCVLITRRNGVLCGLLIGMCTSMLFTPLRCATDQVYVADSGGDLLMREFRVWCKSKRVKRLDMGNSQAERKGADRFMRRHGLQRAGSMYFYNEVDA